MVEDETIYWLEGRPAEGGRGVIVKRTPDGRVSDVTPAGTNVRSRVHEYGGAAYAVSRGTIYYSEFVDQRIYRLPPGGQAEPLTPPGDWFYADFAIDLPRKRLVCVREDHTVNNREAVTTLVSVPLDGPPSSGDIVVAGFDFYAAPRLSPDCSRLSWLAWRHPQMPWDGTELWVATVRADGALAGPTRIAGGDAESIFQPAWSPDGVLYFVSDRTGWWNLYRASPSRVEAVCEMPAEFGRPLWQLGTSTWAFADASRIVAACAQGGRWRLVTIDVTTGRLAAVATDFEPADSVASTRTHAVLVGGWAQAPDAVALVDLASGEVETIRSAATADIDPTFISASEAIEFPTDAGLTAHAFTYAPCSGTFTAPTGERPPLIVVSHGGPTAASHGRLNLEVQVLDEPWVRGGRRELRGEFRLRAFLSTAAARAMGGYRCCRLRECREAPSSAGQGRRQPPYHSWPERRRIHDTCSPHVCSRCVQGGWKLLRRRRSRVAGARHPQVRVQIPRQPDWALPGSSRPATKPGRRFTS